jgi:hypothetical protein
MVLTGEFKKYDYECKEENIKRYGSEEPPHYEISNIKGLEIVLICGTADLLASPIDSAWLKDELIKENIVHYREYGCGHIGLIMPKDTSQIDYIFDRIVEKDKTV